MCRVAVAEARRTYGRHIQAQSADKEGKGEEEGGEEEEEEEVEEEEEE